MAALTGLELEAANRAREALVDHKILPKPCDSDWHQTEATRFEKNQAATNQLARQAEKAGGAGELLSRRITHNERKGTLDLKVRAPR